MLWRPTDKNFSFNSKCTFPALPNKTFSLFPNSRKIWTPREKEDKIALTYYFAVGRQLDSVKLNDATYRLAKQVIELKQGSKWITVLEQGIKNGVPVVLSVFSLLRGLSEEKELFNALFCLIRLHSISSNSLESVIKVSR